MSSGQESQIINKYRALLNPMTTKKIIKKIFKILLPIVLISSSSYITNNVREQFPSIKIESSAIEFSLENGTKFNINIPFPLKNSGLSSPVYKSELHEYCPKEYNYSQYFTYINNLDDASIREGDPILIISNVESNKDRLYNTELFSGIRKDELKKVDIGITNLDLIYFNRRNITTYSLLCYNKELFNPSINQSIVHRNSFKMPSFVDTKIGSFILFITIFVLLSHFIEQIMKIFE